MNNTIFFPASASVAKKINSLHRLLLKEKSLFEEAANTVSDNALRRTLLSVAQQNNQYATELSAHIQTTRTATVAKKRKSGTHAAPSIVKNSIEAGNTVLGVCNSNERKIVTAYKKLLREQTLYDGLQQMMHYQLDGIVFACQQLKLLRSLSRSRRGGHTIAH